MERNRHIDEIKYGQAVEFCSLRPKDYWDTYEAMRIGAFTGQYQLHMPEVGIVGDLLVKAVHPVEIPLTPERENLLRPSDTREGRRQMELWKAE